MSDAREPLLTLEPVIEAVMAGVEAGGWVLSGIQKTTSHEYGGRWEGESSRSAYLFFHSAAFPDSVSVEAFLDETSRGLQGNLAMVVDGPELSELGDPRPALAALAAATRERLPRSHKTPVAIRLRLPDSSRPPESASVELRVKLGIPATTVSSGYGAVSAFATGGVRAFEQLLEHPELRRYVGSR